MRHYFPYCFTNYYSIFGSFHALTNKVRHSRTKIGILIKFTYKLDLNVSPVLA
jgi:hypothetical protein